MAAEKSSSGLPPLRSRACFQTVARESTFPVSGMASKASWTLSTSSSLEVVNQYLEGSFSSSNSPKSSKSASVRALVFGAGAGASWGALRSMTISKGVVPPRFWSMNFMPR